MIDLNKVTVGVLSGIVGGIVAGVGARIAMRIVALIAEGQGSFSLGGTLAILLFGAVLGIVFGPLFVGVRRWLPGPAWLKGLTFGVAGAFIFIAPPFFLVEPEGELAIVSPLVGFSLFGPLPVAFGLVVAPLTGWLDRKYQSAPERRVNLVWFALFGLGGFMSLVGLASLAEAPPFPPFLTRAIQLGEVPFRVYRDLNTALLLFYMLAYLGLAALIFWRASAGWMPRFTALALLFFAGAFFNGGEMLGGMMAALPLARWGTGLVQALGLSALLVLFYLFPDGRFTPRWTRPLAVLAGLWALLWFVNPWPGSPLDPEGWPAFLPLSLVAAFLATGVFAQLDRYRRAAPDQRQQTRWAVVGLTTAVSVFALLSLLMPFVPDLRARWYSEWSALFAFPIYLLPWLLIPLSIGLSIWRGRLWETNAV